MRVLITGAARDLGAGVARRLESAREVESIVGLDILPAQHEGRKFQFVKADTRSASTSALIADLGADVVVHCATRVASTAQSAREAHETNVSGTMHVLAGCGPLTRRLVVKSSVAVYGYSTGQPSLLTERAAGRPAPQSPAGRDLREVEQLARDHHLANPATVLTNLRLGTVLSASWHCPLADYLSMSPVPTVAGSDPRIQLLHEADAVDAVCRAVLADHPGTFNVAGEGIILLSRLIRLVGGRGAATLPPLVGGWLQRQALRTLRGADLPIHLLELLDQGQVVDCTALLEEFGWRPPRTTRDVAEEWVAARMLSEVVAG